MHTEYACQVINLTLLENIIKIPLEKGEYLVKLELYSNYSIYRKKQKSKIGI